VNKRGSGERRKISSSAGFKPLWLTRDRRLYCRLSPTAHQRLLEVAQRTGATPGAVLDRLLRGLPAATLAETVAAQEDEDARAIAAWSDEP